MAVEYVSSYAHWVLAIFVIGYLMIIFEAQVRVNKATSALLMAVFCWTLQFADPNAIQHNTNQLLEHLANVSQVVLFLFGAVTIVETIQVHGGFAIIANFLRFPSKRLSFWVVGIVAFFLSAVLDNLTTTIVMCVMLRKIIHDTQDRLLFGAAIVIAANAGGAWTPIGDVTTTMLWLGGQVSTIPLMQKLFLPSMACLIGSLACITPLIKGRIVSKIANYKEEIAPKGELVLICGLLSLVFVPVFKMLTGLPPFMGILFAMSFIWLLTDILHGEEEARSHLKVTSTFSRLDMASIFFFLGILLSVDALESAGVLKQFAVWLDQAIPSKALIASLIGVVSAVIDNVPLVAACMGMYDLASYAPDHPFWLLIAFCAGTGGSLLIIGSAAGVAFMSLEKVSFFWYLRRATLPAAVGYAAGIGIYLLLS